MATNDHPNAHNAVLGSSPLPQEITNENTLRAILNEEEDCATIMCDPAGLVISWNKAAETIFGYTENEMLGQSIACFYLPEAVEKGEHSNNLQSAILSPDYCAKDWRVKKDGTKFWGHTHYTALFDYNRRVLGFTKSIRELTENKSPEDKRLKQPALIDKKRSGGKKKHRTGDIRFRKLIENSYEGIILVDKHLNIVFRSRSAERISGWTVENRGNNSILEIIHPADQESVWVIFNELAKRPGQSRTCIFRSMRFDGHFIWLECVFTNFFDDPDIGAMVCNFRDISAKKQADELLRLTLEELSAYKLALDESAIVAVTDQKGVINYVNDAFCRISKYSREELIGQDHRIINSSYHDKDYVKNLWATIGTGKIWKGEFRNKAKDGSLYWVDSTVVPFLNEKGKPYQYVAIRFDITGRKKIIAELAESEKKYSELFQLSPLPMMVFDLDTMGFLDVNDATVKHYGYSREELLSMTLKDIKLSEDIPLLEKGLEEDRITKKVNSLGVFRQKKKNGEIINVDVQANFIEYKGREAKVIIANDVTERLNYIKAIESQNEKLKEISWIQSHIVRKPLARMMGLIPLINELKEGSDERETMFEYLVTSANELDEIIKQITNKTIIKED
jgi:PAS domain S-box-containing protein